MRSAGTACRLHELLALQQGSGPARRQSMLAVVPHARFASHHPLEPPIGARSPPVSICTTFSSAMRRCTSSGLLGGSAARSPSTSSSGLRGHTGWRVGEGAGWSGLG